jgi:8-oxo-dGTP diphosphatase
MPYTYEHPRPAVTVDLVIFTIAEHDLKVLLVRRAQEPFKGKWALPGGFVEMDESA